MIFEVGDTVMIKSDIKSGDVKDGMRFVYAMEQYRGMEATVERIGATAGINRDSVGYMSLDIDQGYWKWTPGMLEYSAPKEELVESDCPLSFLM